MEIREVTESLRMHAAKYGDASADERRKNNIDWGKVSLLNQFSELLDMLAEGVEEDIALHFEPKEAPDSQEKLEADVRAFADTVAAYALPGCVEEDFVIEEVSELLRRQRELCKKND